MADKVGLDSGSVPPQNIPPAQADASKAASPAGAGGAESPSQYFYEVAQSGYEFLAKYAQAAAEAQKPKELKPEEAAAHFDQAEKEFQSTYKDAGTGPAAEAQAKSKIDAMQAAMPALMEQAKDPEVQAYLKEFQGGEAAEAESGDAVGTDVSRQGGAPAPNDPAKAKAAFEILSRLRALEKAKREYYSKYRQGSQDDLARRSLEKQRKAEAMLKGMGDELRSQPDSAEAQRLLVEIDTTVGDYVALHRDLQTWKQAAQGLKDPAAKVAELNSVLKEWARQYDKMLDLSAAEVQAEVQAVKDEIVAALRDHPKLISADQKPVPNGAEHVRVMLDRVFPPPLGGTIVRRELLSGLSLEGMGHFAQLSVEADAAMMSAMQKSQAGDAQGAKEDYLKALGAYAELRDEAAARAMDREIRKLLGRGEAPIADYKMLGRIHAELKGSGLKLEAELKEEIASPEWMGFFLESSMKVTNRHLRGADSKVADGQDLAEILEVAENLIQAVKIRQEAGIANDDPVQLMEIDRLQLVMRKNADARKLGSKERLELREKVVRLDVARFPEYVDALTRPIRGAWEPGLLDRIAHPERSGAIGVGIVGEDIGREMLEHLKAWEEDLDHSRLEPKTELDRRADMSAVLSLFYPLTKIGENPPLNQAQLTPLVRRNAEHLQALTSQVIAERFPMVARQPELLQAMGEDVSALSQEAVQRGGASFAALLRNPKGLEAFVAMSYKAYDLETRAKTLEAKVEAAKLKKMPEEKSAKWQAEALHLRMQAAELYSKRGGPPERVKTVLKPAMDFFEGVAADPHLTAAERAESLLDIAKLYQAVRLPEEAARVYEKIVAMERDRYLSGTVDEGLHTAATLAQGHRALLKEPPDYDAAKKFFQSLPGVKEAQRSYDAIVAYQRSQRLPKVLGALEAVAAEYAQKLEQRKGKAEAVKFRAEFKARAKLFRDKLESGDYRTIEDLFAVFGYVRHDAHQGRDFYKWAVGESDSIDWQEFNQKSLSLLQTATNPEATDRDFAALGLEMGTYLGSAGDFDLFQAGAKDVAYFGAASQILDMMGKDQYVGTQAKSYRSGIANRSVIHETGVFLGNLSVVGAESLSEAGKSAALWLVPAGVGRLAGAGARLVGAGERLSILANVAASSLSGMLVESAWTGNWDAFSAKGLATTGTTTFISYFGYRHIARLSQKLGEAAKRSSTFGQRAAGQAAIGFSTRVMLEMGEFTAGGLFEAGMSFAQEGLGIQKVSELEQEASLILRIFSKVLKGGFEEKRENLGEGFAGRLIDYSTGGWLHAVEHKAQLKDRQADIESAARAFGWNLDFNAAKAWIDERRPVDGAKAGEKELAALLSMDPRRLQAIAEDPSKIAQAREAVQKLYPDLDPNSWEAQLRAFQVLDYFEVKGKKGIAEQFSEFQKTAESLGTRSPEHLSAYYELAFRGLTPKQAKKMAKELASTPKLNDKLDVLVDAYVRPGARLGADLRDSMRAEVVLSLLEEAVTSKKSPGALLERDVQAATPLAKAPGARPDAGPYRTQANFAGLPWTLGDIYEGFAKFLGITTQKAAKEQGWKQLDAWVETTSRDPGPSSDAVSSEALARVIAQGGKKPARAADTLVEGSGITHPGLAEKLQLRFQRMGLDAGQISALAKQSAKFQKGLRSIAEGLLGKGALDTPQGQLLAAGLLLKAVDFGAQGKDPAKALQYFENVAQDLGEAKPQLDAAAEKLLQARDVHHSPAAYSVKTTLFLKALQDSAAGKSFEASLAAWTKPAVLGRIAEVLLETEATGVSTPQGRLRITKKFIALLGAAGSPKTLLGALYPAEARPVPLNLQGIASLEEVGGQARTKYAEIEVEAAKAWLFPNPGRQVEVYNPVTKTWIPAKEGQTLKNGTWIRQEGKDLGRKLFTLTPEGDVYLEEIGSVARRMEEGGSVLRALHENFPAWFGVGEALSMRTFGDLTKIVPEFFRRVEDDRNPDWDRWYTEIENAVSALEPAVQALPAHQQAEFRIALMRKLAGGELTVERARAIAEAVLKSPLDPTLFSAGEGRHFGDFFGDFEARQAKQDYGNVFGDETPLGVQGLSEHEFDVFGAGEEMPPPPEEVVPQAIAAAEEDWWLGDGTAPDTELAGVDAVENIIPFLPPERSKAPTVKYPGQLAAARLGQPEAIAKLLGQEAMAEGMRQMEAALQDSAEPAQIFIRLPKGESREDAMVAVSEKADALRLALEDFGGPGELVFFTPTGKRVLIKVEVEGAAAMSPPPKPLFQEEDEAEAAAYYDEVLRALQHDTDPSGYVPPKAEAAPLPDEKDLLHGPVRDRMAKALTDFLGMQVNRARMAEAFPAAAEVFKVFEGAGELIKRIARSGWGSKDWADLKKELESLRPRIEAADSLWVQSQSAKYYMSFLDTAFMPLVLRTHNAPTEAEIPVQAIQTPEWLDSPDFELGMLDDAARAREGKPPRFAAPAMVLQTMDAEAAAKLETAVLEKAEALGLELVAKKPGKFEFRTPMGGSFEVKIEAVPRRISLDPKADKISLETASYLERSGDSWIFKNPGKESWFIGADARGVITGEPVLRDGDLLVSFDGQAVVLEDPVLRAKPAFRTGSGVSALKIPEHPFDKIPPPQELRDRGVRLGRNFEKIEVTYRAKPGEKLLIRRPGQPEPLEVKPLNEAASGGKSAKARPVAVALQAGDVLEIHTVAVGKKNPVASFPFGTYGGLVGLPKLSSQKPVLAGQLTAADREAVTLQDLPAVPPPAAPPWSDLLAGAHRIVLHAVPFLPLMPVFVDAVLSQGLLGGGAQLSMAWFGKIGDKLKGLLSGPSKEEPAQATPLAQADTVSPLEAGTYVWDAGFDIRYLPESADVEIRHPALTGEDVLALLRRDGQDFWVLPRSEVVKVLDAGGRALRLENGFDSQTGEKISRGYRVPDQAYLRIGTRLFARQGSHWVLLQEDPWSGRIFRLTGALEFEIPVEVPRSQDEALIPVAAPMPEPRTVSAAGLDKDAKKIDVEALPLAVQDNQPDKPRRAAYAQNQPTFAYGSFAAHTDEGLGGKSVNEDAYGVLPEYGVAVVADGMGGMGGGDKASAVAVAKLAEIVKDPNWNGDLKQALILAGRAVNQEVNPPSDPTKKAGTTAVIQRVIQKGGKTFAEIAHVGDAGALVLRPKSDGGFEVVFATREQSMVAEWRNLGSLKNTMEMRWSPQAHVVSGGLGLRKDAKPEFASVELQPGDWTLLFSDGIGDNFSKDELSVLVQSSKTPEEARDRILAALRLKMERLQTASAQLEAGQDVFLVPVQEKGADIEELEMLPIDGWQDYYLGEGGKVVGRAVRFKDAQGQVRTGVEVPWAEGRFAVRNAKGEMEYFRGEAVQGLDYFLPVDRYKADNVSIHVYKHELLPAAAEALDVAPTNSQLEEEWRIDDVLDETPQTLVSNIPPTQKMKPVQGEAPPPPTVKLAPIAEEIPPTYKLIQAVSAPKHPEEPGTPASPILARVGTKEIDLSLARKEPQVVYREGPVLVELSVDALGRYLLKGRGFHWGSKPVTVEFEGKKFQLSRMKPSAPPLEAKSARSPDIEKTHVAIVVGASDFKTGLSESKGELAASDIPAGVAMELVAMPTALWDRDSDKNEVRVEDVLAEKPVSVGTLTREEAGGLTLQLRKELLPAYQVDVRDSSMALKKGAKGSVYDPIALAEGDRIGIGPTGIMKFVVARDEQGRLVLRPDGIDQKVRVHLSASGIVSAKSEQPSPFKKMIEDSMKAKGSEEPALPALSPEERLAQASYVSPKERLGIVRDDKVLSDPLSFLRYIDSTKRLLGPELSKKLEFLLVDSPEGRVRIQKLREAVARRAGHSYPNVDQLREYAVQALLQEGIDISERALKELGLQKSLGVVNLTLGEAFLPQLYPNDVPVALASEERKVWILGDSGFSALFNPQHSATFIPGSILGEIRARGYLEAVAGNMLVAGHQFSFKPYPGSLGTAVPVVQLEGQLFSFRQSGDVRAVFTFTSLANPKHQVVVEGPLGTDPKLAIEVARTSAKQAGKATAMEDILPLLLLENPQNIPVKLSLELRAFQILGWIGDQNGETPRAYSVLEGAKDLVDKWGDPVDMHNTLVEMEFLDRYSLSLRAADRELAETLLKMVQDNYGASLDPKQIRGPEAFSDERGKGLLLRLILGQPAGATTVGKMLEVKAYGPD